MTQEHSEPHSESHELHNQAATAAKRLLFDSECSSVAEQTAEQTAFDSSVAGNRPILSERQQKLQRLMRLRCLSIQTLTLYLIPSSHPCCAPRALHSSLSESRGDSRVVICHMRWWHYPPPCVAPCSRAGRLSYCVLLNNCLLAATAVVLCVSNAVILCVSNAVDILCVQCSYVLSNAVILFVSNAGRNRIRDLPAVNRAADSSSAVGFPRPPSDASMAATEQRPLLRRAARGMVMQLRVHQAAMPNRRNLLMAGAAVPPAASQPPQPHLGRRRVAPMTARCCSRVQIRCRTWQQTAVRTAAPASRTASPDWRALP